MTGTLNMTFEEVEGGMSVSIQPHLSDVSAMDRVSLIKCVMDALEYDAHERNFVALSLMTNSWPHESDNKET